MTNCSGCSNPINGSCVFYTGGGISCLDYSNTPTIDEMIEILGARFCELEVPNIGWALNGNTVSTTKSIGTLNPYDFPIVVNTEEVLRFKVDGNITRKGVIYSIYTGGSNVTWGFNAGEDLVSGNFNSLFGQGAGQELINGSGNTLLGAGAGIIATSSNSNSGVGYSALSGLSTGSNNIALGYNALSYLSTGSTNLGIGYNCGILLTTGSNNIFIGTNSTSGAALASNIVIGNNNTVSANSCITIGDTITNNTANSCVIGSETLPITTVFIGEGITSTTPGTIVINGTGGSGANINTGNLVLAAGKPTGTGQCGDIKIQTTVPGTTGSTAQTLGDRVDYVGKYTTLTESSATSFLTISVASSTVAGGMIIVSVEANDGTDFQCRTQRILYSIVNKAGALGMQMATAEESIITSSGTLTFTVTQVDSGGGLCTFKINAVSSLTQIVLRANAIAFKNFGIGSISGV